MTGKTGRTRSLKVPQSHGGCFTCKARRVKCDETRPACQRCTKASRKCEGYRESSPAASSSSSSSRRGLVPTKAPRPTTCVTLASDAAGELSEKLETLRLSDLGCNVIHRNAAKQVGIAASFWAYTVPQLGQSSPEVNAAAAALGAAIETKYFRHQATSFSLIKHYGKAIRHIQDALGAGSPSSAPLITSCLLLAVADALTAQELQALSHLKGTLALLQKRQGSTCVDSPLDWLLGEDQFRDSREAGHFFLTDEFDAAAALLDVGASSYSLGMECHLPRLRTHSFDKLAQGTSELTRIELHVLECLHESYRYAHECSIFKYVPSHLRPSHLEVRQTENVDRLRTLISELNDAIPRFEGREQARARILRAQCNSTMIYRAIVLSPFECSYDKYVDAFRSITDDAEAVRHQRDAEKKDLEVSIEISADLGIIQPLYITTSKCRHPKIRRKALRLLAQTGREGPFEGKRLAPVGKRAIEIEEELSPIALDAFTDETPLKVFVPESERIHGWGVDTLASAALGADDLMAFFCQCTDVHLMMQSTHAEAYKADHFWRIWREKISLQTNIGEVSDTSPWATQIAQQASLVMSMFHLRQPREIPPGSSLRPSEPTSSKSNLTNHVVPNGLTARGSIHAPSSNSSQPRASENSSSEGTSPSTVARGVWLPANANFWGPDVDLDLYSTRNMRMNTVGHADIQRRLLRHGDQSLLGVGRSPRSPTNAGLNPPYDFICEYLDGSDGADAQQVVENADSTADAERVDSLHSQESTLCDVLETSGI